MTPQELKASILQLAIQGKLVKQLTEEGTGEELYQQIQKEKQHLIKDGKIKKEKPLPEITDNEIPFDIPESWKWVRLGEAFCLEMGQSPDGNTVSETNDGIEFHQGKVYFGKSELQHSPQKTTAPTKYAEPDSALLCVRAPVGKVNITRRRICIGRGLCAVKPICGVNIEFVYYWLATLENTFIKKATGTTFVAITGEIVKNQIIPLPCLMEQKRIVAKIEELLPLIDRYEKSWSELEEFNKRFPVDMHKSILQTAIQGKLVPQLPEEGTGEELYQQIQKEKQRLIKEGKIKKEKPLPKITEDEKPFDIPESWKWVRWGEIVNIVSARRVHQSDWKKSGIPFYRAREIAKLATNGYVNNELFISQELYDDFSKSGIPKEGDLMVTAVGTLGKTYIVNATDHFYYKDASVICFENFAQVCPEYLKYIMESELMRSQIQSNSGGTTVATLTMVRMAEYLMPLPPLAEQKRIVAKLEEILPLCERLK